MTYGLELTGHIKGVGQSFEVRTKNGAFAGIVSERFKTGNVKVWFNSTATRGSARKFTSVQGALDFIHARRIKKGLNATA
ncbi:MAG: hypothetical protein R6W87_12010 [Halospina sp.]